MPRPGRHPALHMAAGVADGVHRDVNFGEQHLVARPAAEIAIDRACELILMRENRIQQSCEIGAPLVRGWIGRCREGCCLIFEELFERATHSEGFPMDPVWPRVAPEGSWPKPRLLETPRHS